MCENLAKDKFEKINIKDENLQTFQISFDEDNEFAPIKKKRLIVLSCLKQNKIWNAIIIISFCRPTRNKYVFP